MLKAEKPASPLYVGSIPIPGFCGESSEIFNVAWHLKKQGYSEETVRATVKFLKGMAKFCSLDDPEAVKSYIAWKVCSNGYKENLVNAYDRYARFHGLTWIKPRYMRVPRDPKVPTTQQIEALISFASRNYRPILTLAKYGLRPIEVSMVRRKDVDFDACLVYVRTAKNGCPRTIKLKPSDMVSIAIYLAARRFTLEDRVFPSSRAIQDNYCKIKRKLAEQTGDMRFLTIRLYDFRHYFATSTYRKTRDILYVKQQLGHKRIENTMTYTHLVDFLGEEYICKAASNAEEAKDLIEEGFDYVTEIDGIQLYRKPK